jgi:hypothetical protein
MIAASIDVFSRVTLSVFAKADSFNYDALLLHGCIEQKCCWTTSSSHVSTG